MALGRSGGGRVVRGGLGSNLGTAPRLPRLPALGGVQLKPPSMTSITGGLGLAHLDRAGIGAAQLKLGHKKL